MFASHFPQCDDVIYLNAGTHSRIPHPVLDAIQHELRLFEQNPTMGVFRAWGRLWGIQKQLAHFFHADPHDFILRTNVTAVMNDFILGYQAPRGSEIVSSNLEYGAISNICRFKAESDQLRHRVLELPCLENAYKHLTPEKLAAIVVDQLRPETSILVLSHVMTANGLAMPLKEIAKYTRAHGIFFVVDGAHGPGGVDLDFSQIEDVDCYGGNLHKWMLGPKGTSFGWIPKRNRTRITKRVGGWTSYGTPGPFQQFGEGDLFQQEMMISSCQDFSGMFAIPAMLQFWSSLGERVIRNRVRELQEKLEHTMRDQLGLETLSPPSGPLRGPLLTYKLPEYVQPQAFPWMFQLAQPSGSQPGLQVSVTPIQGQFCLRLSPHIHNRDEDINRAVLILKKAYHKS